MDSQQWHGWFPVCPRHHTYRLGNWKQKLQFHNLTMLSDASAAFGECQILPSETDGKVRHFLFFKVMSKMSNLPWMNKVQCIFFYTPLFLFKEQTCDLSYHNHFVWLIVFLPWRMWSVSGRVWALMPISELCQPLPSGQVLPGPPSARV